MWSYVTESHTFWSSVVRKDYKDTLNALDVFKNKQQKCMK